MVDAHAVRRAIYNNGSVAETLGTYVGCQANAVLGYRCLNRNLPDVTAAKAIERAGQVRARVRVRVRVRVRFRVRVRVRVPVSLPLRRCAKERIGRFSVCHSARTPGTEAPLR